MIRKPYNDTPSSWNENPSPPPDHLCVLPVADSLSSPNLCSLSPITLHNPVIKLHLRRLSSKSASSPSLPLHRRLSRRSVLSEVASPSSASKLPVHNPHKIKSRALYPEHGNCYTRCKPLGGFPVAKQEIAMPVDVVVKGSSRDGVTFCLIPSFRV